MVFSARLRLQAGANSDAAILLVENAAFKCSEYKLQLGELLVTEKSSIGGQKWYKIFDTSNILTTLKLPQTKKYRDTTTVINNSCSLAYASSL